MAVRGASANARAGKDNRNIVPCRHCRWQLQPKVMLSSESSTSCNRSVKICASGTISLSPSEHSRYRSPGLAPCSCISSIDLGARCPRARVTRLRCGDITACSAVMAPASSCSWQQRVVAREQLQLVAAQPVAARIADVADQHALRPERRQHQRGAHALQLRVRHAGVAGSRRWPRPWPPAGPAGSRARRRLRRRHARASGRSWPAAARSAIAAGHFAAVVAAHAVGQHAPAPGRSPRRSASSLWARTRPDVGQRGEIPGQRRAAWRTGSADTRHGLSGARLLDSVSAQAGGVRAVAASGRPATTNNAPAAAAA